MEPMRPKIAILGSEADATQSARGRRSSALNDATLL